MEKLKWECKRQAMYAHDHEGTLYKISYLARTICPEVLEYDLFHKGEHIASSESLEALVKKAEIHEAKIVDDLVRNQSRINKANKALKDFVKRQNG